MLEINGCLVGCHSSDLFSVEGLLIRYRPYLRCTWLRGHSWESAGLVQWDCILIDFAQNGCSFFWFYRLSGLFFPLVLGR